MDHIAAFGLFLWLRTDKNASNLSLRAADRMRLSIAKCRLVDQDVDSRWCSMTMGPSPAEYAHAGQDGGRDQLGRGLAFLMDRFRLGHGHLRFFLYDRRFFGYQRFLGGGRLLRFGTGRLSRLSARRLGAGLVVDELVARRLGFTAFFRRLDGGGLGLRFGCSGQFFDLGRFLLVREVFFYLRLRYFRE